MAYKAPPNRTRDALLGSAGMGKLNPSFVQPIQKQRPSNYDTNWGSAGKIIGGLFPGITPQPNPTGGAGAWGDGMLTDNKWRGQIDPQLPPPGQRGPGDGSMANPVTTGGDKRTYSDPNFDPSKFDPNDRST